MNNKREDGDSCLYLKLSPCLLRSNDNVEQIYVMVMLQAKCSCTHSFCVGPQLTF